MADNLEKVSPTLMCRAELVSDEVCCIAKEISKQSVEGAVWFPSCCLY